MKETRKQEKKAEQDAIAARAAEIKGTYRDKSHEELYHEARRLCREKLGIYLPYGQTYNPAEKIEAAAQVHAILATLRERQDAAFEAFNATASDLSGCTQRELHEQLRGVTGKPEHVWNYPRRFEMYNPQDYERAARAARIQAQLKGVAEVRPELRAEVKVTEWQQDKAKQATLQVYMQPLLQALRDVGVPDEDVAKLASRITPDNSEVVDGRLVITTYNPEFVVKGAGVSHSVTVRNVLLAQGTISTAQARRIPYTTFATPFRLHAPDATTESLLKKRTGLADGLPEEGLPEAALGGSPAISRTLAQILAREDNSYGNDEHQHGNGWDRFGR